MLGYVQIIIAMLIWGSSGVFGRWSGQAPAAIVFYRVLFAALGLGVLHLFARRKETGGHRPTPWLLLLASGVFLSLNWIFFFRAVTTTTLAAAVFSYYVAPVLVTLLSPLLLKERLELRTLVAVGAAVGGLAVMTLQSGLRGSALTGVAYGLIAAFFYALTTISGKRMEGTPPQFMVLVQTLVATVLLAPFALPGLPWSGGIAWPSLGSLGILGVMGLVHTAFALIIYFHGVHRVRVQHVGVLGYLDPLSSVLFGWLLLHERPTVATLAGGALILGATYLVLMPRGKASTSAAA